MSITIVVTVVLANSGLCMGATMLAHALMPGRRIRDEGERKLKGRDVWVRMALNMVLSVALVFAFTHLLASMLFYDRPAPWWRGALEAIGILVLYDFLYYLLH